MIFVTDHKPLVTLFNLKNPIGRTARLLLNQLEGSTYEFRYCPGRLNHLADYLSWSDHQDIPVEASRHVTEINFSSLDWINSRCFISTGTTNITAQTSALFLPNEWLCRHGAVETLQTDRAVQTFLFVDRCKQDAYYRLSPSSKRGR